MKINYIIIFLYCAFALKTNIVCAQQKNIGSKNIPQPEKKTFHEKPPPAKTKSFLSGIFRNRKNPVSTTKIDSANRETVLYSKSISSFMVHDGKVIRNIKMSQYTFKQIFTDTTERIGQIGSRVLDALHTETYSWVIRNNLFFKSGDKLDPYQIADNERYLRSLEFIQDARIVARKVNGSSDSVDVEVITKDYFSITGSFDFGGTGRQKISLAETNLGGAGQKVQLTVLHDNIRSPNFGFDFLYSKTSIAHSFITGTIGYGRINSDPAGNDYIQSFYLRASRPLLSPNAKLAGAFEISFNNSINVYNKPDSQFYNYKNANIDLWTGYNFVGQNLRRNVLARNRTFGAIRYINRNFFPTPVQIGNTFNSFYNSKKAVLAAVTFFRKEYYKTNYIYGFGNTEDVPYGYNLAITGGWYKQLELARPYIGFDANFFSVTNKKRFLQYYLRSGIFSNKGHFEDISFVLGGSMFSPLHYFKSFKMRQFYKVNFSRIFARNAIDPLQINNPLGLRYFKADSLKGTQRLSFYTESFFFSKYRVFGFLFAPFVFADASMLKEEGKSIFKSDIYTGIGGGLRTRNVNLVFGTVELRFIYFPRKAQENNPFVISFSTDIRLRYNGNYISPPDIIQLNSENNYSFY